MSRPKRDYRAELYATTVRRSGLSDEAGGWVAGFTDGEGCFVITKTSKGGYVCSFHIKLRSDDLPLLEAIRGTFGHGRIASVARSSPERHPQAHLRVQTKAGCLYLVDLFTEFPLRSKKAADFAVWKEAVIFWQTVGGGTTDWSEMAHLADELRTVRVFRELAAEASA